MKTIIISAITANGKIARAKNELVCSWTSREGMKIFVSETKKAGVVIMGLTTYQTIGKPLPGRLNVIMTSHAREFENIEGSLEYHAEPPGQLIELLAKRGFTECVIGGGASVYTQFLQARLVDELLLTIEPKIFGHGVDFLKEMDLEIDLDLLEIIDADKKSITLRYKIVKS